MSEPITLPWSWVTPLDDVNGALEVELAKLDAYREAWEEFIGRLSEDEFAETRRRTLTRHAIETGIIERLYVASHGVTEALVAEGLVREVAERAEGELVEGELKEDAFVTIETQFEALEFLAGSVKAGRTLSVSFIKQLHVAITRNQPTFKARDTLGRPGELRLRHGEWKRQNNHVLRDDGSLLQYTPYEHVDAEMDRLVDLYAEMDDSHPIVRAAWLHHRFIGVHPFEDGNGRIARALVLLVLLQARWAPLVVEGSRRTEYLDKLDAANGGDLAPLVRFFADLERRALVSELQRSVTVGPTAVDVARGYAERIRAEQTAADEIRATEASALASELQIRIERELSRLGEELRSAFVDVDHAAHQNVLPKSPPEPEARYWYAQLVRAAKAANFFANLAEGTWWVRLRLVVLGQELRYVVATQKVGHGETGILAVTIFSELVPPRVTPRVGGGDDQTQASGADEEVGAGPAAVLLFSSSSEDLITLSHTDSVDDRWVDVCELVERTLTASVAEFGRLLG